LPRWTHRISIPQLPTPPSTASASTTCILISTAPRRRQDLAEDRHRPSDNEPVNTSRRSQAERLLFAGTERTVYVSFDDGDHWQSLKQNLPSTSIRDLVIHGDDIVVGTHGRSFWILDNITPLRQFNSEVASAPTHLFAPQLTYRVRRNNNTDTPLPPEEPAGRILPMTP